MSLRKFFLPNMFPKLFGTPPTIKIKLLNKSKSNKDDFFVGRSRGRFVAFVTGGLGRGLRQLSIAYVSPGWVLGRLSTNLSKREDRESPTASMVLTCWRLSLRNSSMKSFNSFHLKKSNDINNLSMCLIEKNHPAYYKPYDSTNKFYISNKCFPSFLKTAEVNQIFKIDDPCSINNYRPTSILPTQTKI